MVFLQKYKKNISVIIPVLFIAVILNILIDVAATDKMYFSVLILYILVNFFGRVKSSVTFVFLLVLLLIMSIRYLIAGPDLIAEKAAVWFVLFMAFGLYQKWREI